MGTTPRYVHYEFTQCASARHFEKIEESESTEQNEPGKPLFGKHISASSVVSSTRIKICPDRYGFQGKQAMSVGISSSALNEHMRTGESQDSQAVSCQLFVFKTLLSVKSHFIQGHHCWSFHSSSAVFVNIAS